MRFFPSLQLPPPHGQLCWARGEVPPEIAFLTPRRLCHLLEGVPTDPYSYCHVRYLCSLDSPAPYMWNTQVTSMLSSLCVFWSNSPGQWENYDSCRPKPSYLQWAASLLWPFSSLLCKIRRIPTLHYNLKTSQGNMFKCFVNYADHVWVIFPV